MSDTDHIPSRSEELLSAALRDLARSAPQSASPETRAALALAFHRHHVRRRAMRMVAVLAVILAAGAGSLWLRTGFKSKPHAQQAGVTSPNSRSQPLPEKHAVATTVDQHKPQQPETVIPLRRNPFDAGMNGLQAGGEFIALPAFALETPGEDLRVIRVEMPVSSLRLLGARVNDELITRRIVADLLVGADGTPYAFRLIT